MKAPDFIDPRKLLAKYGLRPKRRYSQNFLVSRHAVETIAEAAIPLDDTAVIELGAGLGTLTAALLRAGAKVTAVDRTEKLEMLRAIGADHVIDYTKQHFSENGETYDVILDVIFKSSFSRSLKSLAENGRLLLANPRFSLLFRGPWTSRTTSKRVFAVPASESSEDLRFLAELIAAGEIKPHIGRRYSLEQMAEAHVHVESGLKQGHVIITSGQSSATQQAR